MPDPSPLQQLLLGTYKDSTPTEGKPKEPTTRTSKDVLSSLLQGERTPYDNPEQESIYQDYKLSSAITQYVELGQGSNFQASDPTKTTFNPETVYQSDWSDWSNQLLNSIDAIDKSKWEGRANDAQHKIDLISKKLEDPNISDAEYVSLTGQLDEHIKELEESNQWAKEQQQNIDDNPITRSYAQTAEAFQQDENTNPWDYIMYELPTDLGGSASEMATMVGMMFGPEVLAIAAEAAIGGSALGPIGTAVLGVAGLIGGGIAMYNMRSNETDAEAADAYNQKLESLTSDFISTNGREPDYNELRDLRLDAYKGIDALKARNMALSVGDYAQLGLMLIPGSGLIKSAFAGAGLKTKIAMSAGSFMGAAMMEGAEEGDQFQIKQDYLKGILEDKGLFGTLEDSLKYRTTSLAAMMGIDIPGVSDDVDFRNSVRSGLILGGGMSLGSSVKNTVSDIKDFKSTKEFIANNRAMLFDQEITENKAKAYLDFFNKNKTGFLYKQLAEVDLSATPELNNEANRAAAIADAKQANALYSTIKANEGSAKTTLSNIVDKFKKPNGNVDALFTEAYKVATEIKKSEKLRTKYLTEARSLLSDESGSLNPKVFTADVINTNAQILQAQEALKAAKNLLQTTDVSEVQRDNVEALVKANETKLVTLVENLNKLIPDTAIKRSTIDTYIPTSTKDIALAEVYDKLMPHEIALLELQDQFVALVSKGKNDTKDKVFKAYEAKPKEEKNKKADKKAKEADKQANDELDNSLNLDDISELSGTVSIDSEEAEATPSTTVEEGSTQEDGSSDIESEDELTSLDDLLNGISETSESETEVEDTTEPVTTVETASSDIEQSNDTPTSKQVSLERAIAKVLRLGGIAKQSLIDNAGVYYTVNGTNYQRQSEYNADENTFTRNLKDFGKTLSKFRENLTNVDNGATVGNYIDIVSREVFNNSNLTFEEFNAKAADDINYQYNFINTVETFNKLKKNILQIKEELKAKHGGDKVRFITDPMFVFSNRTVDNYGGVGGALDMLVIDADNNVHIYDFKNKKGESSAAVKTNLITYKNTKDKWSKQQATYLQLFEETTGVKPVSTNIIVFPTMYKPDSFLGTTQEDVDSFKPIPKVTDKQLVSGDAFIVELSGKADLRDNTVLASETGIPIQPVVETSTSTSNLAETREFVVTADLENVETIDNINSAAELNKVEFDKEATKTNPYTTTWKSVNNTQATALEKQDQRLIELSSFLENPDNNLSEYTVEFQIDVQYLKEHKVLGATSLVDVVTGTNKNADVKMSDVSRLPVRCLFRDSKGNIAKNSMGNPHYIFLEDPIAGRFEKNSAKQAAIELADLKLKILRAHTQGVSISTKVESKSRGYVSFSKDETTGKFEASNVSSVLGIPSDSLNLVIGGKNKTYMTAKKQLSMDLMHIGNTATPGAVYVLIKDASGNMFPLRLHSSKLTKDECNLIVEIYSLLANNPKLFNSPIVVSESVINIIRESKDPRVNQLPIKLNEITHAQLLNTLLYEGRKVSTSKNKVFMNDVGQLAIGDKTFSKEELVNNRGEIIALLSARVTRQVNLKELGNKEYVKYLIDNNVVTTNAVPTTSKSIFAQPVITLSRDVKKETFKPVVNETTTSTQTQQTPTTDANPADIIFNQRDELEALKFKEDINTKQIEFSEIFKKEEDKITLMLWEVLKPYIRNGAKIYYQDGYYFAGSSELAAEYGYAATIDGKGNILIFDKTKLDSDTILHELLHDFLFDAININKDEVLITELQRIFDKVKKDADLVERYSYAFNNLDEFVSEVFGNKGFRQELSYIKDFKLNRTSSIFDSISKAIKDFLKRKFGFEIDNTILDNIFNAVEHTIKEKNKTNVKSELADLKDKVVDSGDVEDVGTKILKLLSKSDKKGVDKIKRRSELGGLSIIDAAKEYLENYSSVSGEGKNRFEELEIQAKAVEQSLPTQEAKDKLVGSGVDTKAEYKREDFPDSQANTRTPVTQKLLDYFAEVLGIPKFTEDLSKGTYISWLQKVNPLGYAIAEKLNAPKQAFDIIAEYDAELAALNKPNALSTEEVRSKLDELKLKLSRARKARSKEAIQKEIDELLEANPIVEEAKDAQSNTAKQDEIIRVRNKAGFSGSVDGHNVSPIYDKKSGYRTDSYYSDDLRNNLGGGLVGGVKGAPLLSNIKGEISRFKIKGNVLYAAVRVYDVARGGWGSLQFMAVKENDILTDEEIYDILETNLKEVLKSKYIKEVGSQLHVTPGILHDATLVPFSSKINEAATKQQPETVDITDITTVDASYADDIFGMGEVYQEELSEDVRKLIEFYGTLQQSSLDKLGYSTVEDLINEANTSLLATDEFIENIKKCRL